MNDLISLNLSETLSAIKEKKFLQSELTKKYLERIQANKDKLFSFTWINENAVEESREMEKNNFNEKKLSGIPVAIKEVLSTKNIPTTASSKILEGYVPVYDATVVRRLKEQGAIIIGKTNCDSFAFGASTENSGYGVTKNPWDTNRVPGGSSGGSAVAVSADECVFALGTDTGGSIRQPASFCNITGLKPTYGACSRYGLLAMASSFDCPGPMTKSVEDCRIVFDIIKGGDGKDATCNDPALLIPRRTARGAGKLKIGVPKEYFSEGVDEEVKTLVSNAIQLLNKNGFDVEEISLPNTKYGIEVYYVLVPSEISSNMARYTGTRFGKDREFLEDEVKRRIIIGTYSLSAGYFDQFYAKASKVRSIIKQDYLSAFEKVDLIIGPVSPTPAFKIGERTNDLVQMYLSDILTVSANLAGIPSLALPCGFTKNKLPVGMQILGPHFSEDLLFKVGEQYQLLTNFHKEKPIL
jgi:aspartyl-tRNA(Asn)/glutamyl-tRNA(Gln) amidotransferase subunit A